MSPATAAAQMVFGAGFSSGLGSAGFFLPQNRCRAAGQSQRHYGCESAKRRHHWANLGRCPANYREKSTVYFCRTGRYSPADAFLVHLTFVAGCTAKAADWQLVWSDEFNGSKLDYGKWGVSVDAFGGGNQEMQLYTDRAKNVRVENGKLIIEAHRDNQTYRARKRPFSSGRISHQAPRRLALRKIEIRAKLANRQGHLARHLDAPDR